MAEQEMDGQRLFKNPGFCINDIPKSVLNNLNNYKRNALMTSWEGSHYYVMNVNRARTKRCIQNKLLKFNEND